jgi:hypothetical protein
MRIVPAIGVAYCFRHGRLQPAAAATAASAAT